ncbi:MAG: glucose 1-dehydrogenase [Burkholderiales bacterium]|nr:glucose 1-dehydrogenase [Burkholderiales bacterium]
MTTRLAGRTAVVTGAGAGFGAGIAERFALEGARVVCVDVAGEAAARIAARFPGGAVPLACDIADGASFARMVEDAVARAGPFDTIVNNAALSQKPSRIAKIAEADLDRLLAVNVKSFYHVAVHALPVLRRRGGGCVINIASVTAIRPRPGMCWYQATKAAVVSITQTMAAELAPDRIRVNAIAPSVGRTAMLDAMFGTDRGEPIDRMVATIPLGRLCEPADIAGAAVYLASDDASFVTGVILPVDGGRLVG